MIEQPTIYDFYAGAFLLVDKPLHWTSFDVVNKLRATIQHTYGKKLKVGHAGTLDPLATGLIIVATGKYTKQLAMLTGQDKTYEAVIGLGHTSASYDRETPLESRGNPEAITSKDLQAVLAQFTGAIMQQPPVFSAIKQGGKPLYKSARKGESVSIPPRPVFIHSIALTSWEPPLLHCNITCSKGTYIRSLAHDVGAALGVGGYLHDLRRTQSGDFSVDRAKTVAEWVALIQQEDRI